MALFLDEPDLQSHARAVTAHGRALPPWSPARSCVAQQSRAGARFAAAAILRVRKPAVQISTAAALNKIRFTRAKAPQPIGKDRQGSLRGSVA